MRLLRCLPLALLLLVGVPPVVGLLPALPRESNREVREAATTLPPAPAPDRVLNLAASVAAPVPGRPGGYDVLNVEGRVVRARAEDLPFRLAAPSGRHAKVLRHALQTWNRAGAGAGVGSFFALADGAHEQDVELDWTGRGLRPQAAGVTRMTLGPRRAVARAIVLDGARPDGTVAAVLIHELGHVLGLDHSKVPSDIMYETEQDCSGLPAESLELSNRDRQTVTWLYGQPDFVPLVPRGRMLLR